MGPLISVIIPVYQVEKYINKCVKSVVRQSYSNLEIILVDDGSKDRSGEICDQLAKEDARIKVIHQKNGGLSLARNTGLDCCRGQYITFVDSDDFLMPQMVEWLWKQLQFSKVRLAVCSWQNVEENMDATMAQIDEAITIEEPDEGSCLILSKEEAMEKMLYQRETDSCAWAKLYERSLFDTIRFPNGKLFEDIAIMYQVVDQCEIVSFSQMRGYCYLQRNNSIMGNSFSPQKMDLIEFVQELLVWVKENHSCLEAAAVSRLVRANFTIYMQIPYDAENKRYRQLIENNIKEHRKTILEDPKAKKGTKIAVLITYLGFGLFYRLRFFSSLGKK